jgi:PST family polysaccharide transporter
MTAVEPAQAEAPLWRPMVLALGKTGGASMVSGLVGALGIKIVASLLGPGVLAWLQTLQQVRDGAVIVATANGRMALVQGASELDGVRRREFVRTVAVLFSCGAFVVAAAITAAPAAFVRWNRLPEGSESVLPWVALSIALISVFTFLTAILNALGAIGKLAMLQLISPLAAALVAWPVAMAVRQGRPAAIAGYIAIPAAASAWAGLLALRGHRAEVSAWVRGAGRVFAAGAARHFFSVSSAMLVSGLAATAVLLAVRGSITRAENLSATGQFDAAWNISMNHVTLILGSIQAYYLPLLSGARSQEQRARQVRGMLVVASLATAPVIVALACMKPWVVAILYSHAFSASPRILRWTLVADYLKVSAWVFMTPMLAARRLGAFLVVDLLAQAVFLGGARLFSRVPSASEGAAIGFLASNVVRFALSMAYAELRLELPLGVNAVAAWGAGLVLVISASAWFWTAQSTELAAALLWATAATGICAAFALYVRGRKP